MNQAKKPQTQNCDINTDLCKFSEKQRDFIFNDLASTLKSTKRFSKPVISYLSQIIIEEKENRPEYWKDLTEDLRAAVKKSYKTGNSLNIFRMELSELAAWTKEMEKAVEKEIQKSAKKLSNHDIVNIETYRAFLEGEANFLSKLLFKGELTNQCQTRIFKEITKQINRFNKLEKIDHIYTRINKLERCYESIIFQKTTITISRSLKDSDTEDHIHKTIELLKEKETLTKSIEEDVVEIADVLISIPATELKVMSHTIQKSMKKISIHLHYINILGNIVSVELPKDYRKKIIKIALESNTDLITTFRQELLNIFSPERTFKLTSSDGWFKQAISWHEKLNLLIDIEKALNSGKKIKEIKNIIKTSFESQETLKHSKDGTKIGNTQIDQWINTLDDISQDKLGYKLRFNFHNMKNLPRLSEKKALFLTRFRSKMSGEKFYIPDRWEGIIYDMLGQLTKRNNITNTFTIRIRKNIEKYKEILENQIIQRLERIAARDLRNLSKLFQAQKFLENIWMKKGYISPKKILISCSDGTNNPLNKLKDISVKFNAVDGVRILKKLYGKIESLKKVDATVIRELYCNRNIINTAINSENIITENIKKGIAFDYLSKSTIDEIPIPRFSNSRGIKFAELTNENEKAAAVRIFMDLVTNSKEGRNVLIKIGMISRETGMALNSPRNKIKFEFDWTTGISVQKIEGLTTGLLDGIITVKDDRKYLHEFIVEMIGTQKGQLLGDYGRSPLSTVIGDLLRIGSYRALNKPGMVVYVYYDKKGSLNYSIITFNEQIGNILRNFGVYLAVDINRPQIRKLIERNQLEISKQFEKVFKIFPDLNFETKLWDFMSNKTSNEEIFIIFFKLIKIIINQDKKSFSNYI